jgi:hypothetical protein
MHDEFDHRKGGNIHTGTDMAPVRYTTTVPVPLFPRALGRLAVVTRTVVARRHLGHRNRDERHDDDIHICPSFIPGDILIVAGSTGQDSPVRLSFNRIVHLASKKGHNAVLGRAVASANKGTKRLSKPFTSYVEASILLSLVQSQTPYVLSEVLKTFAVSKRTFAIIFVVFLHTGR